MSELPRDENGGRIAASSQHNAAAFVAQIRPSTQCDIEMKSLIAIHVVTAIQCMMLCNLEIRSLYLKLSLSNCCLQAQKVRYF